MKFVLEYLKAWLEWAEKESESNAESEDERFVKTQGLCSCLFYWWGVEGAGKIAYGDVQVELYRLLRKDYGIASRYPFGGSLHYGAEAREQAMHQNTERIAWVRKTIKELEEALLLEFLKAWIKWVDEGAQSGNPFLRTRGLCYNALVYGVCKRKAGLKRALVKRFPAGLPYRKDTTEDVSCVEYPFGGEVVFDEEMEAGTMHLNARRVAWVRQTIKELENERSISSAA